MNQIKPFRNGGKIRYINRWIKYIVCFSNFIFILIGAFMLTIGSIAFRDSNLSSISYMNIWYFFLNLSVVCIIAGLLIILIAFFGFFGSLKEKPVFLKIYYITMVIFLLLELSLFFGIFFVRETIKFHLENFIKETFIMQYREIGYEDTSNLIDLFQRSFECCGPNSYRDWDENRYFKCKSTLASPWKCGVPHSCCRKMNDIDEGVINTMCGLNVNIELNSYQSKAYISNAFVNSQKIWQKGCVQALYNYIEDNITIFVVVIVVILILQIAFIVMAKNLQNQIADQIRLLTHEKNFLRKLQA